MTELGTRDREDVDAFAHLYAERHAPMVRLATALVGDASLAADLVHDAFVAVHGRLADIDHPAAYLRATVVNACRMHHRRADVERRHRPPAPPPVTPPEVDELWRLVRDLPTDQQVALALRFGEDLAVSDVAATMDCPVGTAKSNIHRGLARLRKALT